ncbi:MAG TPA: hypothetical protein VFM96_13570 [Gaiellaceae bacterium]|nr:hypothetical protein [Gaiellaceae bacterium]
MRQKRFVLLAVALVALNAFFWLAQGGFALSQGLIGQFFGGRLVRAEVLVVAPGTTTTQDYRLDQGVIVALGTGNTSITLRERNGDMVPLAIDPNAQVHFGTTIGTVSQLQRRMRVLVIRLANAPATAIDVLGFT